MGIPSCIFYAADFSAYKNFLYLVVVFVFLQFPLSIIIVRIFLELQTIYFELSSEKRIDHLLSAEEGIFILINSTFTFGNFIKVFYL